MGARKASVTAVTAVVGIALLMTLLVAWASSVGPSGILTGDGPPTVRVTATEEESESASESAAGDTVGDQPERRQADLEWLRWVAIALELLLALAAAYVAYRGVRWAWETWDARRRPDPPPVDVDFDLLGSPEVLAAELVAEAGAQRGVLLAGGSPRNAVVEAWHLFETAAGRVGAHRRPWETSSEFTLRVLAAVDADSTAVSALARLYREARFSEHDLSEDDRAAAVAALDAVHASLGLRAGGPA